MKTDRFVITVIGVDTVGIVAGVTRVMSDYGVNIIDIRQTLMEDIFTMLMIGEVKNDAFVLKDFQEKMTETGNELKVEIRVQHEDVFRYMHRI
ncbi:ACT domain-containing protein [Methanimicrococcus sp. OttesenSCG-928-J09]|nr:ACT domain-containing protein [Methanimicrococcus sp. OttesenSCG-928-J09]